MDFVRTILNYVERGIRTFSYELEIPKKRNINQLLTLTEDELITIKRTPIPIHLKAAKDWLIISCYVGQRVSDFMNFQMEMMAVIDGIPCMSFKQQKTQKDILLPLHPIALEVMSENNQAFPLRLSNQKYNEQIKQVVQLAGIKNLVKVHKRNGHRGQDMVLQNGKPLRAILDDVALLLIFTEKFLRHYLWKRQVIARSKCSIVMFHLQIRKELLP